MKKILIVEDEKKIAFAIERGLKNEGFEVQLVENGKDAVFYATKSEYDCIILDRMLPFIEGVEVCKEIRKANIKTPIIMLTAKSGIDDKVEGLDAGADDYLTKPFSFEELLARIRALLRRPQDLISDLLIVDDLTLNTKTFDVARDGKKISLSKTEFELLKYMMENAGQILTKGKIINDVWDFDSDVLPNTVEAYIGYLRNKIDKPFKSRDLIKTVRGFGYKLDGELK